MGDCLGEAVFAEGRLSESKHSVVISAQGRLLDTAAMSVELSRGLTGLDPNFPVFVPADCDSISWNLRPGEVGGAPDPYVHWKGSYFELDGDGVPIGAVWRECLNELATDNGVALGAAFCKGGMVMPGGRIFYSPGKAVLWTTGMIGLDGNNNTIPEHVFVRRPSASDGAVLT